jgi:hypothetical protein
LSALPTFLTLLSEGGCSTWAVYERVPHRQMSATMQYILARDW